MTATPRASLNPPFRGTRLRTFLRVALVVLLVLVASVAVLIGWLQSDSGRRYLARRIESSVSKEIQGTLHIGAITALTTRGVSGRDVRFTAPGGGDVIVIENVDLDVRWLPLVRGRLVSPRARVKGARVVLREGRDGELTIKTTMRSRTSSSGGRSSQPRREEAGETTVDLQHIELSDTTFVSNVSDVPDARVTGIRGTLQITVRKPDEEPVITLRRFSGRGRLDTPIPIEMGLTDGTFRFDATSSDRVQANARTEFDANRASIRCTARVVGDDTRVAVRLSMPEDAGALAGFPVIMQGNALDLASSNFEFSVARD